MNILFVCTGNSCRSPMAEVAMRCLAHRRGAQDVHVDSAGVSALDGMTMTDEAKEALEAEGFSVQPEPRSAALRAPHVEWADLIVVMTAEHRREVLRRFPDSADKVRTLLSWSNKVPDADVADPVGLPFSSYRRCLKQMLPAIQALLDDVQ